LDAHQVPIATKHQLELFLQNQNSFFQVGDQQYCLFCLNGFHNDHVEGLAHLIIDLMVPSFVQLYQMHCVQGHLLR